LAILLGKSAPGGHGNEIRGRQYRSFQSSGTPIIVKLNILNKIVIIINNEHFFRLAS
jgi:hypothetical protein